MKAVHTGAPIFCLILIISGCMAESKKTQEPVKAAWKISAATDKRTYHSKQTMWVNVTMESDQEGEAEIYIHGIKSGRQEHLRMRSNETIKSGFNMFAKKFRVPDCATCAGIQPGAYTVAVDARFQGEKRTVTLRVEVLQ